MVQTNIWEESYDLTNVGAIHFIPSRKRQYPNPRKKSVLSTSLRLNGIIDILETIIPQPLYFTQVMKQSKITYKKSFLNYLRFCKEHGFVCTYTEPTHHYIDRYRGRHRGEKGYTFYKITDKGRLFLEMVK